MLNPKHQKYADRMRELIQEGQTLCEHPVQEQGPFASAPYIRDRIRLNAWVVKVENILVNIFGTSSVQVGRFKANASIFNVDDVFRIGGILVGSLNDLENGFMVGQEFIVASEVFDSVLDQAKHLLSAGYKDPAAILARVVLEDALKRLARANGIPDNQKASVINTQLRQASIYPLQQERLVMARLDIGNAAAHGNFNDYSQDDVSGMIEDIERFLAFHFASP